MPLPVWLPGPMFLLSGRAPGQTPPGQRPSPPHTHTGKEWSVRILLECILVYLTFLRSNLKKRQKSGIYVNEVKWCHDIMPLGNDKACDVNTTMLFFDSNAKVWNSVTTFHVMSKAYTNVSQNISTVSTGTHKFSLNASANNKAFE